MPSADTAERRASALDFTRFPNLRQETPAAAATGPSRPVALRSITVLGDLSDASEVALQRAAALAGAHDASLKLVAWAGRGDVSHGLLRARLSRIGRRVARQHQRPILMAETPLRRVGEARDVLRHTDLVVAPKTLHAGLASFWRPSVASRLASVLPVPLLVVNEPCGLAYQRVLAGVDLQAEPERLVHWALALAGEREVALLHVLRQWRPSKLRTGHDGLRTLELDLRRRVTQFERVVDAQGPQAERLRMMLALGDDVAAELLARRPGAGSQLIVVGRSTEAPWLDALLGSVTRSVLRASPYDVLVVPVSSALMAAVPGQA